VERNICSSIDLPHILELSTRSTAESRESCLIIEDQIDCHLEYIRSLTDAEKIDIEAGSGKCKRRGKGSMYTTDTSTEIFQDEIPVQPTMLHSYTHRACPICAEEYQEGDDICWSRNENCAHAFHLDCKVSYLQNTDACILCKNEFLARSTSDTEASSDK